MSSRSNENKNIISLFAGCGGLDLGFRNAGFSIIWANEYDKDIWETYSGNHPQTFLDKRSITEIQLSEIPECTGIIGGPPCQSWSEAGAQKGIDDKRGQLFWEYIRILEGKRPQFFLAENVSGILFSKFEDALQNIVQAFRNAGYHVLLQLVNAKNYNVPQDRKRVIIIGIREDFIQNFEFPTIKKTIPNLKDAIWDLKDSVLPATEKNLANEGKCEIPNHEYMLGGFSSMYMSRNRVRTWSEPSFTIQAGGRHAPIHPQANIMVKIGKDEFEFDEKSPGLYRRLSVRECARIQTFPDDFVFHYSNVAIGYKMIGNAVPVHLAFEIANEIRRSIFSENNVSLDNRQAKNSAPKQLTLSLYRDLQKMS